jgi:predicted metal-dependent phosphoesterase TrpH
LIDLHLHTTASDGLLAPAALVSRAAANGLRTISITDHDTCAGLAEAADAARRFDLRVVPGVEITAVEEGRDVHMLAYFLDISTGTFTEFLQSQRTTRIERVREISDRLRELGNPVDIDAVLSPGRIADGRSIGRPQLADALVRAGHAQDRDDAFERLLGAGRPAFVPRRGPAPETVIAIVRDAGGIVSLAHPGLTRMDFLIPRLVGAGLQSLEVRHSDHDAATEDRYRKIAADYALAVSGGSDFHGDTGRRASMLGRVTLSSEDFAALESRRA